MRERKFQGAGTAGFVLNSGLERLNLRFREREREDNSVFIEFQSFYFFSFQYKALQQVEPQLLDPATLLGLQDAETIQQLEVHLSQKYLREPAHV
jgi:hypothetical protein